MVQNDIREAVMELNKPSNEEGGRAEKKKEKKPS